MRYAIAAALTVLLVAGCENSAPAKPTHARQYGFSCYGTDGVFTSGVYGGNAIYVVPNDVHCRAPAR